IASLGRPEIIRDIQAALKGFGEALERVGKAVAGPLVAAFGKLARASVPFLKEVGEMVAGVVERFSAWSSAADKSGALDQFMRDAAQALRDIWDIGGLVVGIIGDIIEILFPSSKQVSDGIFSGVKGMLQEIKDWLGDPENQQKLKDFIDKIQDFVEEATTEWIPKTIDFMNRVDGWIDRVVDWGETMRNWRVEGAAAASLVAGRVEA